MQGLARSRPGVCAVGGVDVEMELGGRESCSDGAVMGWSADEMGVMLKVCSL